MYMMQWFEHINLEVLRERPFIEDLSGTRAGVIVSKCNKFNGVFGS